MRKILAGEIGMNSDADRTRLARERAIRQIERGSRFWIIYPAIPWAFLTAAYAWSVFLRRPISECEIRREIDRQAR
jgi:hypothetical protein